VLKGTSLEIPKFPLQQTAKKQPTNDIEDNESKISKNPKAQGQPVVSMSTMKSTLQTEMKNL
jgi:hypothetical protein